MTENEMINGWTFEETIKTTENLMEAESNMFTWDVLRHLRDFVESFKDELKQYRAIGTVEEFKSLKECFGHTTPKSRGKAIYDKAIDKFTEKLKSDEFQKYNLDMVFETSRDLSYTNCISAFCEYIDEMAKQMKGE